MEPNDSARAQLASDLLAIPMQKQGPTITEVADLIPIPKASTRVADWPADERELYNQYAGWQSFKMRDQALSRFRQLKAAQRIMELFS